MASGQQQFPDKLIVDSIHGDIRLKPIEQRVVDTASFQRLRYLKQLGMAQFTYPNATHTRFAHSIGVLGIMAKVADVARDALNLTNEKLEDIRLAGLLHDIGHYPYSHLMEKIDKVQLAEELVEGSAKTFDAGMVKYPDHEDVGEWIVTSQDDLRAALGGEERARRIALLFTRKTTEDPQLSKLIHSSLDMDRLDYLLRDSHATGVPYGQIDLNYLLNNLKASPKGMVGVLEKALTAAEHCLLARFFMHRTVYYHKTTFGLEEACRQLLRRIRDKKMYNLPADGNAVKELVKGAHLGLFTDAFVDAIVERASQEEDSVIKVLANSIKKRRPPKLLKEVLVLEDNTRRSTHAGVLFKQNCRHKLRSLAEGADISLGRFLVCETKPFTLEERGSRLTEEQARTLAPEEKEELIKVFVGNEEEPKSIVNISYSILGLCSNHFFQAFRLYLVADEQTDDALIDQLRTQVAAWDNAS